jgi:hypothetical protein
MSCLNNVKVADGEVSRRDEVTQMLDYIHRQLGQLKILNDLPRIDISCIALENRALDVESAVLTYLAVHICREGNRLGIIGNSFVRPETYARKYRSLNLQRQ